jgi:hypothetical protein
VLFRMADFRSYGTERVISKAMCSESVGSHVKYTAFLRCLSTFPSCGCTVAAWGRLRQWFEGSLQAPHESSSPSPVTADCKMIGTPPRVSSCSNVAINKPYKIQAQADSELDRVNAFPAGDVCLNLVSVAPTLGF